MKYIKKFNINEVIGLIILISALVTLFVSPGSLADLFGTVIRRVKPPIVDVFITGIVGVAIICSVIIGRLLERAGFTDALIRIFVPFMKLININPSVLIPSIYNILGDINAAGKIAGPIMLKAGATKDEQKLAIVTMVQSQQSFSTFMLGLMAMAAAGINSFPVVVLAVFGPLFIVPFILSKIVYKDTKSISIEELPKFTPEKNYIKTLFDAAKEGAELLFLLIIPAAAAIFTIIGVLDFLNIWEPFESILTYALNMLSIDPKSGVDSILVSPTLGMGNLSETAANLDPKLVVGSFVLAASGFPLATVFGQIPAVWSVVSDLNEREIILAASLGVLMRVFTAFLIATFVTPFII